MSRHRTQWTQIGNVAVDSGGLMITDPCYVKDFRDEGCGDLATYYRDKNTGKIWALRFHAGETPRIPDANWFPGSYDVVIPELGRSPNQLIYEDKVWETLPDPEIAEELFPYTYAGYCKATNHKRKWAGSMAFNAGHEGSGVCFASGYGDGFYPVYARYNDEGRVAEVRIKMIDDEDRDNDE